MNTRRVHSFRATAVVAALVVLAAACVSPPPDPGAPTAPTVAATIEVCHPELGVSLTGSQSVATAGQTISYDAELRNDPAGPCLDTLSGPRLAGSLSIAAGTARQDLTGIAMWLQTTTGGVTTVLPTSAGLTAGGPAFPDTCPGATPTGCTQGAQPTYGNVDYPDTLPTAIPANTASAVEFTYFPTLDADDITWLRDNSGTVTLVVAVTTTTTTVLNRHPVLFTAATPATEVSLTVTRPDTTTAVVPIGDLAPGAQSDVDAVASYTVRETDSDSIETSAVATFHDGPVPRSTPPAVARTAVILDPNSKPTMLPTVSPDVVRPGAPTEVLFSVVPRGPVTGALTLTQDNTGTVGTLTDDGTNGDVIAGDSVYATTVNVAVTAPTQFTVSGTVAANPASGAVTLDALAEPAPLRAAKPDLDRLVVGEDDRTNIIATQFLLRLDDTGTYGDAVVAANAVTGTVIGRLSRNTWQVSIPAVADVAAMNNTLATVSSQPKVIGAEPDAVVSVSATRPHDPRIEDQWYLETEKVPYAWTFDPDVPDVIAAVVDTGVQANHPDLDGAVLQGWDFVDDDNNANDERGHGTHVAGTIGARMNNFAFIAGMTSNVQILPVRVLGADGSGSISQIAEGIRWAVDHGARVINLSLGGSTRSEEYADAIDYAWNRDRVVAAAAGNDNCSERQYPAGFDRTERFTSWFGLNERSYDTELIAVGAVDQDSHRSVWDEDAVGCVEDAGSNFNPGLGSDAWVDLAAGGTHILSTIPWNSSDYFNGTSMATPQVSGAAAMMLAQDPILGAGGVKARLMSTAQPIPDQWLGAGVIDVYDATFNSSFERGDTSGWVTTNTVEVLNRLGPIRPPNGTHMAMLSTGPAGAVTKSTMTKFLWVNTEALEDDELRLSFWYNYVTEEYPEWVGSSYNDQFTVTLVLPSGERRPVVEESVNTTPFTPVSGIDLPGGDDTVGQSGWQLAEVVVAADELDGSASLLQLVVEDQGDSVYDSVALLDTFSIS